jgi:hypothetical protein
MPLPTTHAPTESVEEILAEAAAANARLMVARAMVERLARGQGRSEAQVAAEVAEVEEALTEHLVFGKAKVPKLPKRNSASASRACPASSRSSPRLSTAAMGKSSRVGKTMRIS